MLWATSPACTELETHVLDWLVPMLGLPEKFLSSSSGGGVIQDTASSASLCAMLAARERATNHAAITREVMESLVAYTSTQAHSSIEKAAMVAGIGTDNLRLIEVDRTICHVAGSTGRQVSAIERRAGSLLCLCYRGYNFFQCHGSFAGDRRRSAASMALVPRGRRHVGNCCTMSGISIYPERTGIRRQLYLQSA